MKKNIVVYLVFIALIAIIIYNHFFYDPAAGPSPILDDLNRLQNEALAVQKEMVKLLISLALALFGLIGYFTTENYKTSGKLEGKFRFDILLAFCLCAISIDFGYIFMEKWVEQLSFGIFKPYDSLVLQPLRFQLISFLLSLFFTGRLIYRSILKS